MDQEAFSHRYPQAGPDPDGTGQDPGADRTTEAARLSGVREAARASSRRHSRRVRIMRILVPASGVLLLLVIVGMIGISNYLSGLGLGTVSFTADGLVMDSPELSGNDGERSYRVSAERAIQRISDPRIIDLETITAELRISADQSLDIVAARGTYNSAEETLFLADGIDVVTNDGETAAFGTLQIALKTGTIRSDDPVELTSSFGALRAGRMQFDQDNGTLTFTQGIQMTIQPPQPETRQ
ncbi:LPS export ABC transporter periplasmic protein LptC [Stappia stellulata]|uniref:LPS export ABC transporter periplasmic protein LptC n=1 Tax=Stappia stellulata TaxID=71235 RepID=UPI00040EAB14|nr:LPS export ABC transporter periplasmic protein LptC [Stappia stellulata]